MNDEIESRNGGAFDGHLLQMHPRLWRNKYRYLIPLIEESTPLHVPPPIDDMTHLFLKFISPRSKVQISLRQPPNNQELSTQKPTSSFSSTNQPRRTESPQSMRSECQKNSVCFYRLYFGCRNYSTPICTEKIYSNTIGFPPSHRDPSSKCQKCAIWPPPDKILRHHKKWRDKLHFRTRILLQS